MLRHSLLLLFSTVWLHAVGLSALTLDDAIRLTWQNDPHAAALALAPELARAREVQAGLAPAPVLELRAAVPAAGDSEWSAGVGVSRTLARRERLELARAYARLGSEAAAHHLQARRLALADTVRRLAYDLALGAARVAAARRAVATLREFETTLDARREAGEVADFDLALLAFEIARAEQNVALAEAEHAGQLARLRQHLLAPDAVLSDATLDLDALLARPVPACSTPASPALALAELSRREAEAALALAQAESRPEWTLGAGLELERRANDATGELESTPILDLSASRPWPGVIANRGTILERRADLRLSEAHRSALATELAAELAASVAAAEAVRPAIASHRELLARAAALPAKLQSAFARGEITAAQLAAVRQQLHAVEADFLVAAGRYLALLAAAETAAGTLPTTTP